MSEIELLTAYRQEMHKIQIKNGFTDEQMTSYRQGFMDAIGEYEQRIVADVQPVNQWISVKDRLPDESCECLGVVDGEVMEVSYSPKQRGYICVWSMCDADGFKPLSDDAVTHWMPMPEPPQD